ncbi:MAG: chemotaxis protein CheW [Acidobacteria bacterium]|nr:chemotaxis protein CheW [Acidobacteriota bacterium]
MINDVSQYLTFKLADEPFGINVGQVREILDVSPATSLPGAPPHIRGVVNVRGNPVPVADLRLKFGLPPAPDTVHTRVILLQVDMDGPMAVIGAIADSVHGVIDLAPDPVNPPPRLALRWQSGQIQGTGRRSDEFIIILDINEVFSPDDLAPSCS